MTSLITLEVISFYLSDCPLMPVEEDLTPARIQTAWEHHNRHQATSPFNRRMVEGMIDVLSGQFCHIIEMLQRKAPEEDVVVAATKLKRVLDVLDLTLTLNARLYESRQALAECYAHTSPGTAVLLSDLRIPKSGTKNSELVAA